MSQNNLINNGNQQDSRNLIHQAKIQLPSYLPYKCATTSKLLKYQWVIFSCISILILSTLDAQFNNLRIVCYSLLFLLVEGLKNTDKLVQIQDPLGLKPSRKFIKQFVILLQINMIYLLFRILIEHHNIYSFLLFVHYSFVGMLGLGNGIEKTNKKSNSAYYLQTFMSPSSSSDTSSNIWKILTPLLLFIFSVIINRPISQISLLQLILLTFNLILTIEIKSLLVNKQCALFGWQKHNFEGKNHLIFIKNQALKKIIFSICAGVVIQNLMCILPGINQYASFTMVHTLILGSYVYVIYSKEAK